MFQNFYTLIFRKTIKPKKYLFSLFFLFLLILLSAFLLHIIDFQTNGNDIIRHYQLKKINDKNFTNISTIILGDSSAGNAIDAKYFSNLSKKHTINLALTGSWGIVGSLGILKQAVKKNSHLRNIIIIHTLDIWERSFAEESILELYPIKDIFKYITIPTLLSYYFNPKEIEWNLKSLLSSKNINKINYTYDYIEQKNHKYSNNMKLINPHYSFNKLKINPEKLVELNMLEKFCQKNSLNCILMNGPIHISIAKNSTQYINVLQSKLKELKYIKYIPNIFSYSQECIGDSLDHIDIHCKQQVTEDYFNLLKKNLQ